MHMREEPRDRAAPMAVAHTVQRIPNTRDENPDKRDRKHHSSHEHSSKRKHRDELLEELVPRETGRDAQLEKRRERGSFVREKAAEKDAAGTDLEIREGDLMVGTCWCQCANS